MGKHICLQFEVIWSCVKQCSVESVTGFFPGFIEGIGSMNEGEGAPMIMSVLRCAPSVV